MASSPLGSQGRSADIFLLELPPDDVLGS